jgi:thiol-disulfide isomerase/thioredoxin
MGAAAFPWDQAAMASFEEAKKAKIEMLKSNLTDMKFLTEPGEEGPVVSIPKDEESKLKERLFIGDDEGVVSLYFSAHLFPPCQMFTRKLVECYKELKAAGKKFEVVFISSDSSKDEFENYYKSMVTSPGDQFLALDYKQRDLKRDLSSVFDVSGIPTLILLKSDGSLISSEGVRGVYSSGAKWFPWDDATVERVANEQRIAALQQEKPARLNRQLSRRPQQQHGSLFHDRHLVPVPAESGVASLELHHPPYGRTEPLAVAYIPPNEGNQIHPRGQCLSTPEDLERHQVYGSRNNG